MTNRGSGYDNSDNGYDNGDGSIDDLPWASVFDPAANARALSAIQAEGFRAASRIVDRFVRAVGSAANGTDSSDVPDGAVNGVNGTAPAGLQEFERLTRAWWSMAGQFLLRAMPVPASTDRGTVALDLNNPDAKGGLTLEAPAPGSASAEVWLHNTGGEDRPDVTLRCSDLLSHGGDVIHAGAVVTGSAAVPMPRRSSRGVTVTVNVAADVRPGVYRGTLLATGHPDLWLPVMLTVRLPGT